MRPVMEFQQAIEQFLEDVFTRLKKHDVETYEHCHRVGEMTFKLAQALSLSKEDQSIAYYAGALHDIGKLLIPEEIINKPGKLTNEEYDVVKKHAQYGVDLLEPLQHLPFFKKVREAVLYHHERIDGKGYYNLTEQQIPVASKLILICDTVDAMTQDRAYRKGLPLSVACDELIRCSGTQFDAHMVDVFLEAVIPDALPKAA
ncbi:MAG: HD domain-containing protein [Bdellovibrionales bacterium]|nr:HD domain-containing protein [Bdellovibrionales bacterium]